MLQFMNEITASDAKYGKAMAILGASAVIVGGAIVILATMSR